MNTTHFLAPRSSSQLSVALSVRQKCSPGLHARTRRTRWEIGEGDWDEKRGKLPGICRAQPLIARQQPPSCGRCPTDARGILSHTAQLQGRTQPRWPMAKQQRLRVEWAIIPRLACACHLAEFRSREEGEGGLMRVIMGDASRIVAQPGMACRLPARASSHSLDQDTFLEA
jgi:hypothetical protein